MNPPPPTRATSWLVDLLIAGGIATAWVIGIGTLTSWHRVVLLDTFRDMAWAENMRAGRLWTDPTLPGYPYWYAPGGPLLVAGLSRLTGWSVIDLCGYSPLWLNVWIPVGLYLLVRAVWTRGTALLALPLVLGGSYWWLTLAATYIPGLQGVVLNLLGLWLWHRSGAATTRARGSAWALVTGGVLALSTWQHPVCGLLLAGAIGLHALLIAGTARGAAGRPHALGRMLIVAVVAATATAPFSLHMLDLQSRNTGLVRFFASELIEPPYYAHAYTPLVVVLALSGVWTMARTARQALWIVTYAVVGLIGQALGYLGHSPGWRVPYILPHEFQWHGQLAVGVCAAVGVAALGRRLGQRWPARVGVSPASAILVTAAAIAPALRYLPQAAQHFVDLEPLLARTQALRTWITAHTTLEDVIVAPPDTAYMVVAGLTGRKTVVVWPGHINPRADYEQRQTDVKALLEATDEAAFVTLARRCGVRYLVLQPSSAAEASERLARYRNWAQVRAVDVGDPLTLIFTIDLEAPPAGRHP